MAESWLPSIGAVRKYWDGDATGAMVVNDDMETYVVYQDLGEGNGVYALRLSQEDLLFRAYTQPATVAVHLDDSVEVVHQTGTVRESLQRLYGQVLLALGLSPRDEY